MQAGIEQGRLVAVKLNAPGFVRPVGILLGMLMAAREA
jgi:hypothetical protein